MKNITSVLFENIVYTCFLVFVILYVLSCKKDAPPLDEITLELQKITNLPSDLKESSGLYAETDDRIWSHNDKGGDSKLYAFSKTGDLKKTVQISNASNKDWEDLAQDKNGYIYISDTGNNENNRQDLKIYKIKKSDLENASVNAEVINFVFSDQTQFPPPNSEMKYDVESLIATNDSLYLLTRDRTKPFKGQCNYYVLPQEPGTYVAQHRGLFQTDSNEDAGAIRGAAISSDGEKIALLSKTDIWVFSDFSAGNFFNGTVKRHQLSSNTKKEGIDFIDNCTIFVSDEKGGDGGNLYSANICL